MSSANLKDNESKFLTDEDFLKVLGIYFDVTSNLIDSSTNHGVSGATFLARMGFGVGLVIDLNINIKK